MHVSTYGLWPQAKTKETTTTGLGITGGGTKGGMVILPNVMYRDRSDPGGTVSPTVFNIVVDTVAKALLLEVCGL